MYRHTAQLKTACELIKFSESAEDNKRHGADKACLTDTKDILTCIRTSVFYGPQLKSGSSEQQNLSCSTSVTRFPVAVWQLLIQNLSAVISLAQLMEQPVSLQSVNLAAPSHFIHKYFIMSDTQFELWPARRSAEVTHLASQAPHTWRGPCFIGTPERFQDELMARASITKLPVKQVTSLPQLPYQLAINRSVCYRRIKVCFGKCESVVFEVDAGCRWKYCSCELTFWCVSVVSNQVGLFRPAAPSRRLYLLLTDCFHSL